MTPTDVPPPCLARVLPGIGIGSVSALLMDSQRLVLVDNDALYVWQLQNQFGHRPDIRVLWADRLFPLARLLDYCLPVPAKSLITVGRRN